MPKPLIAIVPGVAYRIRTGQTIAGDVYSNTAITIIGRFRIIYDDGTPDEWFVQDQASGSSRAQVVWVTGHKAPKDGWVVGGALTYKEAYIQRGQCYIRAVIADPANLANYSDVLMRDYLSQSVTLGRNVDPGPAGGYGSISNQTLASPAAGADYANVAIPTGALWRLKGFFGQLVTGAGAGNREFSIQYFTTTIRGGAVAGEIQTATLTVDYVGVDGGLSSSGVTSNLAGGVTQIGLGSILLNGAIHLLAFKTYNIQAADQWGTGNVVIEEWVMPN